MMKLFFVICCVVAVTLAAPKPFKDEDVPTLISFANNNSGRGPYSFSYENSDGSSRQESAELVNAEDPDKATLVVKGTYSYITPEGEKFTYNYVADENGYRVNRVL